VGATRNGSVATPGHMQITFGARRNLWEYWTREQQERQREISNCYVGECGLAGCGLLEPLCPGYVPMQITSEPIVWTLVRLTCPIAFAGFHFHFPVSIYWFFLANAATYALVGLVVETLRRQLHHAK
jgi:hypothetical protein